MAGVKGRSGRRGKITEEEFLAGKRQGTPSWPNHPTALAGYYLNGLIEMWLGGVPIQIAPKRWLVQPTERRYTVPPKVKRVMAQLAIKQAQIIHPGRIDVDDVLAWARRRAPDHTFRRKARKSTSSF
jgi:hypothetical protein